MSGRVRRLLPAVLVTVFAMPIGSAAQLDRGAVDFVEPDQIAWVRNAAGTNESAVLFGDPNQPGPYVMRLRWLPGNMSRPHCHQNDRFFVVISGTWWVGSGETFDPDSTTPVGPGSYVLHSAGRYHYDGAKDEPAVIQVVGVGPTSPPEEGCR